MLQLGRNTRHKYTGGTLVVPHTCYMVPGTIGTGIDYDIGYQVPDKASNRVLRLTTQLRTASSCPRAAR